MNNIKQHFSQQMFWDIDIEKLDVEKNKCWFINRVLEYGLTNDWQKLLKYYDIKEIAEISMNIKNLDIKSANLVSLLSGVPLNQFLCYNSRLLTQKYWNF
jgi:hypothetical protein